MNEISFSLISKIGGPLTKIIRPNPDGAGIIKDATHCMMTKGEVETVTIPFKEFGPYIRSLNKNQAIAHSVCDAGTALIVSESKYSGQPRTITRTKRFLHYPDGPGIGMFDYDPNPGQAPLPPDAFKAIIESACPSFQDVATIITPSTSSCIYVAEGTELSGLSSGFHMYFAVKNPRLLPVFAETLFKRLVLIGCGDPFVTKAGVVLVRTLFDASVFSPERLDFVAGAVCEGGCYQQLPDPVYREGGLLCLD